jgi:hypothetical protein
MYCKAVVVMKKVLSAITLSTLVLATILLGSVYSSSSSKLAFAASEQKTSQECKDAAKKISDKAEAHQSNNVCGIELSRDSPTITLIKYQWNSHTNLLLHPLTIGE